MKKQRDHFVTELTVIDYYSYDTPDERSEDIENFKFQYPDVKIIESDFPKLNQYWLTVTIPRASITEKIYIPVYN